MEKIEETLALINQRLDALEDLVNGKAKAKKASPKNKTPAVSKTIPEFLDYIEDILEHPITTKTSFLCAHCSKTGAKKDKPCCKPAKFYLDEDGAVHDLFDDEDKFQFTELSKETSHFLRCSGCKTKATDPKTSNANIKFTAFLEGKTNEATDKVVEEHAKDLVNTLAGTKEDPAESVNRFLAGSPADVSPTKAKASPASSFDGEVKKVGDTWYNAYSVEEDDSEYKLVFELKEKKDGTPSKRSPTCIGYTEKEEIDDTILEDLKEVPENIFKKVRKPGFKYEFHQTVVETIEEEKEDEGAPKPVLPSVQKDAFEATTEEEDEDNPEANELDNLLSQLAN